jgi:ATP diphosphatase
VSKRSIDELLRIMAALRDPQNGCPWDVKQTFETIAPYTIEEAYEVADAIDRKAYSDLRDELGDLLLQVVFHARIAEEAGHFRFEDVVASICDKMIRRHPHVFDRDAKKLADADTQTVAWEEHKRRERAANGETDASLLAGISRGLPEWQRALKLQKRARASDSIGPNRPRCWKNCARKSRKCARNSIAAPIRIASPMRSATCCSSRSIWRA